MWFFLIFFSIILVMYLYPSWRIIPTLFKPPLSIFAWFSVCCSFAFLIGHVVMRRRGTSEFATDLFGQLGFLVLGFMTLLFCMVIIRDLALIVTRLCKFGSNKYRKKPHKIDHHKRALLINGSNLAMLGMGAMASTYGYGQAKKTPELVSHQVSLPNLHSDCKGITILQFTDIHVGATIKRDFIQQLVNQCRAIQPDILVITGDLADGQAFLLRDEVQDLDNLEPPLGKFFVTGNHEYYSDPSGWLKEIKELGFDTLLNEHRVIKRGECEFILAGVTDYEAGRIVPSHKSDPAKALEGTAPNSTKILLAHQPKSIFEAAELGVDFQISGHTHGGQYIPGNFFVPLDQPYVAGWYKYKNTQLYVSKGSGYWGPPLRLGASSEITLFTLA